MPTQVNALSGRMLGPANTPDTPLSDPSAQAPSLYSEAMHHPRATLLSAATLSIVIAAGLRARRRMAERGRESELSSLPNAS